MSEDSFSTNFGSVIAGSAKGGITDT